MTNDIFALSIIVNTDAVKKADAIILLEGDGYHRVESAVRMYTEGFAPVIVVSGGAVHQGSFTVPAPALAEKIVRAGIPQRRVIVEAESRSTREQAVAVMKIARENKWKKIILVASAFHQVRAYLTFLQAMKEMHMKFVIFNAPVRGLPWFRETSSERTRIALLASEMEKINVYAKKGHIASFSEMFAYERWKEKQH